MVEIELRDGISLQAPAGARLQEGNGTDSQVGKIIGPGFECQYDIGLYSNDLKTFAGATLIETLVAGHPARLMQQGDAMDALHIPQVSKTRLGEVKLTLFCKSSSEQARAAVRAMFKTLRITS